MAKLRVFVPICLFLVSLGCTSAQPRVEPRPAPSTPSETLKKNEKEVMERIKAEEEAFNVMSAKMDEYQELLSVCDRLSDTVEDTALKTACRERLKVLRRELEELSAFLREQE